MKRGTVDREEQASRASGAFSHWKKKPKKRWFRDWVSVGFYYYYYSPFPHGSLEVATVVASFRVRLFRPFYLP